MLYIKKNKDQPYSQQNKHYNMHYLKNTFWATERMLIEIQISILFALS